MAASLVATVTITDPEKFGQYAKAIAGVAETFGGEYVCRGPVAEVLEGNINPGERVIVASFPDADAAHAYIASPEYRYGAQLREGAGTVLMRLLVD